MSDPAAPTPPADPETPPAGDPGTPPPADPAPTDPPASDPPADPAPDELTAEQLRRELEKTRREAATYRTKAKAAEEAAEAARLAELSELEQAQERATRLEAERDAAELARRQTAAEAAILAAARNFNDPSDAVAFLASQVEFDEDGKPKDVAGLVKGLADAKPHLVTPAPGAHGGNPHRPGGGGSTQTDRERLEAVRNGGGSRLPWLK